LNFVKQEYTITIYAENTPSLLTRVALIFSRRRIDIKCLNMAPAEIEKIYRITIVVIDSEEVVRKLTLHIKKQLEVLIVFFNAAEEIIVVEQALYKVAFTSITQKNTIKKLLQPFNPAVLLDTDSYIIYRTIDTQETTNAILELLKSFELAEFVRSARIAVIKSNNEVHKELSQFLLTDSNF